jgi:hypothetical protein
MMITNGLYSINTKLLDGVDGGATGISVLPVCGIGRREGWAVLPSWFHIVKATAAVKPVN